jgi:hypothetical protein
MGEGGIGMRQGCPGTPRARGGSLVVRGMVSSSMVVRQSTKGTPGGAGRIVVVSWLAGGWVGGAGGRRARPGAGLSSVLHAAQRGAPRRGGAKTVATAPASAAWKRSGLMLRTAPIRRPPAERPSMHSVPGLV